MKPREFKFRQYNKRIYTAIADASCSKYIVQYFDEYGKPRCVIRTWEQIQNNGSLFKLDGSGKW